MLAQQAQVHRHLLLDGHRLDVQLAQVGRRALDAAGVAGLGAGELPQVRHAVPVGVVAGGVRRVLELLAVEGLRDAAGRDWVFDKDRRERSLDEAERELWMARAEYLREMID